MPRAFTKILESKKRGGWDRSRFSAKFVTARWRVSHARFRRLYYTAISPKNATYSFKNALYPCLSRE